MANYTTTKFTATEKIGDSVFNKNMITEGFITIIPNHGYVVSASDFSLPNLPSELSSVVFTDTKVAGQPGNQVTVTATFADTFVVAKRNKINLYFAGDATTWNPNATTAINVNISITDDKNYNKNASAIITAESDYVVNPITTVGTDGVFDITKNVITGSAIRGDSTKIGTVSVTANDGYYFRELPYLKYQDRSSSNIKMKLSSTSRNSNKRITSYIFDLSYKNSRNINLSNPLTASIFYSSVIEPVATREVKYIECGDTISESGGTKYIKVYGDVGAEFDLTITKGTDGASSILKTPSRLLNGNAPNKRKITNLINTPAGAVDSITKKITAAGRKAANISYCTIEQEFPANNEVIRTTTADGGGISGTTATFASIADVKVGDRLFMDAIPTNTIVKVTSLISGVRCELDTSVTAAGGAAAVFRRQESYDINIYPKAGTTLSSRIPLVKPHYTITQYKNPALKFTATTANAKITAPADVSVTGSKPNTLVSRGLRESLTVTAASGTSVVSYYKAGKDRGRRDFFRLTYTVASSHAITKTKDPVWSNKNVYGKNGALTSSSDWTNSIATENGGTEIQIASVESSIVASPSHVYTLAFDVLIKKFGTEDTTLVLNLDNLITA